MLLSNETTPAFNTCTKSMNSIKNPLSDKRYCDPLNPCQAGSRSAWMRRSCDRLSQKSQSSRRQKCLVIAVYSIVKSLFFKPSLDITTLSDMVFEVKEKIVEKLQTTLVAE